MIHKDPDCGQTITFFQFFFIAVAGAANFVSFDSKSNYWISLAPRKISFLYHALLVILSWIAAYTSAKAYYFKISVSLHMVFKSGILVINMFLGYLLVKKKYTKFQAFAVFLVTLGVLITTLASLPEQDVIHFNFCVY
jgi:UDP-xylose/UDP-N-acetylglucosamine transporter B4